MRQVSIGSAGLRLRRSYNQVQRLVMLGELKGERREDGSWAIDGEDLDRYCAEHGVGGVGAKSARSAAA